MDERERMEMAQAVTCVRLARECMIEASRHLESVTGVKEDVVRLNALHMGMTLLEDRMGKRMFGRNDE